MSILEHPVHDKRLRPDFEDKKKVNRVEKWHTVAADVAKDCTFSFQLGIHHFSFSCFILLFFLFFISLRILSIDPPRIALIFFTHFFCISLGILFFHCQLEITRKLDGENSRINYKFIIYSFHLCPPDSYTNFPSHWQIRGKIWYFSSSSDYLYSFELFWYTCPENNNNYNWNLLGRIQDH